MSYFDFEILISGLSSYFDGGRLTETKNIKSRNCLASGQVQVLNVKFS